MGCPLDGTATAEIYINEIFFDPGGAGQDNRDEYIELRGTAGMSLSNHYLIFVEQEDNEAHTGGAGRIENIFDLGALPAPALGANGFLLLRQDGNLYDDDGVALGANSIEHDDGSATLTFGWGDNNTNPGSSLVGHSGITNAGARSVVLENGGATAMLISTDGILAPVLFSSPGVPFDMDNGNNGLDTTDNDTLDWRDHWTILDSIGHFENDEIEFGRMYGRVNFAPDLIGEPIVPEDPLSPVLTPELLASKLEPGAEYAGVGFEVEALARWGNSSGHTSADWHVFNLTDNSGSGSAGINPSAVPPVIDYRLSCSDAADGTSCHPDDDDDPETPAPQPAVPPFAIESNKGVPYGTKLTTTLGAPNYLTGDYNGDGVVDAGDYVIWRKTINETGTESNHPAADANHDFLVDGADYASWMAYFGQPQSLAAGAGSSSSSSTPAVPEPATWLLALAGVSLFPRRENRR